jgi:circadian clock protein KaiB
MNRTPVVKFRLYVAGDARNSLQALANLRAICETYLLDQYKIEIVDVLQQPHRALIDSVFISPSPERRIIGTLSEKQTVLDAVSIACFAA